jgi:hypothetical protein
MTILTKNDLTAYTKRFFDTHWGIAFPPPTWNFSWDWVGPIPNYQLGGLYALFVGEELVYIGLGASRGGGRYQDSGISRRLGAHVYRVAPPGDKYVPRERWEQLGVTMVATLGFLADYNYLAPALEDYLIGKLSPCENAMKKNSIAT